MVKSSWALRHHDVWSIKQESAIPDCFGIALPLFVIRAEVSVYCTRGNTVVSHRRAQAMSPAETC